MAAQGPDPYLKVGLAVSRSLRLRFLSEEVEDVRLEIADIQKELHPVTAGCIDVQNSNYESLIFTSTMMRFW